MFSPAVESRPVNGRLYNFRQSSILFLARSQMMNEIAVTRSVYIPAPSPEGYAQVRDIAYVSRDKPVLIACVDINRKGVIRRSEDGGQTWRDLEPWPTEMTIDERRGLSRDMPLHGLDPATGKAFRVYYENHNLRGVVAWDPRNICYQTRRMFWQVSLDEGLTWSDPKQLVCRGDAFDETNWAPGVEHGINSSVISTKPFLIDDAGRMVLPYNMPIRFGDTIHDPAVPKARSSPDGDHQFASGVFFASWSGDELVWDMGEGVTLDRAHSCDGADEPSIAPLPDGRWFMVLRARRFENTGQTAPPQHYYALSHDQGKTWDDAQPLVYDDGSTAMAPACLAHAFRSTKNGRVYVITNFTDHPAMNCDPRNECWIVEIDPDTCRIKRDTMTTIDRADIMPGKWPPPRFSNFIWYEDRATGDIVLLMTPSPGDDPRPMDTSALRYDIALPR
jgi:hypothetical protein